MCPLCWKSNVLPELDLTGLFHLPSVGGPIKREQGKINGGNSFSQICPAEFSLAAGGDLLERFFKIKRKVFSSSSHFIILSGSYRLTFTV